MKYFLKKGAKKVGLDDDEEEKKEEKWNPDELAVGNWFHATSYYKALSIDGDKVLTQSNGK